MDHPSVVLLGIVRKAGPKDGAKKERSIFPQENARAALERKEALVSAHPFPLARHVRHTNQNTRRGGALFSKANCTNFTNVHYAASNWSRLCRCLLEKILISGAVGRESRRWQRQTDEVETDCWPRVAVESRCQDDAIRCVDAKKEAALLAQHACPFGDGGQRDKVGFAMTERDRELDLQFPA